MSKRPHIFAHCVAGCKWEVPHKADVPYREDITVIKNGTLSLGDAVEVADTGMLNSALMGATIKLTIEVTPNASYQGNLYTAFFTADNVYRNWLIPTDECGFVEMVVTYSGSNPTKVSLTLMTETTNIIKVKEFVVCQLGVPVFAMTGATELSAGKAGTVPAPEAGEHDFVLHGDGTWREHTATDEQVGRAVENYLAENTVGKETWTFTLEDGSTVTKAVYVG